MQMEVRNFCPIKNERSRVAMLEFLSFPEELPLYKIVLASPSDFGVDHIDATGLEHSQTPARQSFYEERCMSWAVMSLRG